jgi:hypothetical protein
MIKKNIFGSKYITSLQTTLREGQFVLEKQTLNKAKSLMRQAGACRPTVSKTEGQILEPR